MIDDEQPEFGRDHNQPPALLALEPAVLDFREFLAEREQTGGKTFAQRKAEFLRAAGNAVVRNRETAGAAADVVKLAGRVWDAIHAARLERTNAYRDVADALGRAAVDFWLDVDEAMVELRRRIDAWTAEEDKLIEAQRLEQEREMERLRPKPAPVVILEEPDSYPDPKPTGRSSVPYDTRQAAPAAPAASAPLPAKRRKIRGDYGATISEAERTTYSVYDVRALPDYILNAPGVHEAIIAAVRGTVKVMGVPPGIAVSTTTENQIR